MALRVGNVCTFVGKTAQILKPLKPAGTVLGAANIAYGKCVYMHNSGLIPLDVELQATGMKLLISESIMWVRRGLKLLK